MSSDLTLKPDFQFVQTEEWSTAISRFENGTEQRRPLWGTARKKWKLQYVNRLIADFQTIQTLFNQKKGAALSLSWDNPNDGSTYWVRFEDDKIDFTLKAFQIYDFEFSLIQIK